MLDLKIAPSILSADFGDLNADIKLIEPCADLIHIDVMDGHFVPNITIGAPVVAKIKSKLPLDCHLMIENPVNFIKDFAKAGASIVTIHREVFDSKNDVLAAIRMIKGSGVQAGISINPDKDISCLEDEVLKEVSLVLLMTVFPGFGGQKFLDSVLPNIKALRKKMPDLDIQVDGGINDKTALLVKEAGANILVAGSYIFGARDRKEAIEKLRE